MRCLFRRGGRFGPGLCTKALFIGRRSWHLAASESHQGIYPSVTDLNKWLSRDNINTGLPNIRTKPMSYEIIVAEMCPSK